MGTAQRAALTLAVSQPLLERVKYDLAYINPHHRYEAAHIDSFNDSKLSRSERGPGCYPKLLSTKLDRSTTLVS